MEVFICHLLLIFFRSAKLNFVAKGKGPFFAQNFKLVCDNYLDPLHLLSRKPEALCCTLIQCQLGTRSRGGGVLQGGGRIIKIFNFLQWPRWPSTAWRGSTSQHRPASDHLSLDLLFGLKLANGRIRATATNINELNSNRNPTINGLMYWVDGTGWRI